MGNVLSGNAERLYTLSDDGGNAVGMLGLWLLMLGAATALASGIAAAAMSRRSGYQPVGPAVKDCRERSAQLVPRTRRAGLDRAPAVSPLLGSHGCARFPD